MRPLARHHRLSPISFLPDRFLDLIDVDADSDHLLWMGNPTALGYPRVWDGKRLVMLSRWIATEVHGPPPTPQHQAGHTCHDERLHECAGIPPEYDWHRLCCNPEHIAWQTPRENVMASARGMARINQRKKAERLALPKVPVTPWWLSEAEQQISADYARIL